MKYIELPDYQTHRLPFYLAMEEYIARCFDEDACFFMWQVDPTVIFGRNQLIENEVNLEYCRSHGIQTYRRKSGGGCVYADRGNIMLSYIARAASVSYTFDSYLRMVAFVLRKLGVPAEASGRNDILIDGKKVSGNAFYYLQNKSIVHGTMLFDSDLDTMIAAITPTGEKLSSKGIASVRQRVTNLSDYLKTDQDSFTQFVRNQLCDSSIQLNTTDVQKIREIEQEYLTDEFIYGHNPQYTLCKHKRIGQAGELEIRLEIRNNRIKRINLLGDYFLTGNLDDELLVPLIGCRFEREAVAQAIEHINIGNIILHLDNTQFLDLLFN